MRIIVDLVEEQFSLVYKLTISERDRLQRVQDAKPSLRREDRINFLDEILDRLSDAETAAHEKEAIE